jgi:hypothetical protein
MSAILTAHLFRRGSGQAANENRDQTPQWVFGHGDSNLLSIRNGVKYIADTTDDVETILKVFNRCMLSDGKFGSHTRSKLGEFNAALFAFCSGLQAPQLNVHTSVSDAVSAHLIKAFPRLKSMNGGAPVVCLLRNLCWHRL